MQTAKSSDYRNAVADSIIKARENLRAHRDTLATHQETLDTHTNQIAYTEGYHPAPASCYDADSDTHLTFTIGDDSAIWYKIYATGEWSEWASAGGSWTSGVGCYCSVGTVYLYVRSDEGHLYLRHYEIGNGTWDDWIDLGGSMY